MIKAKQVPDVAWRVAMMTYHREIRRNPGQAWQLAIAAALTSWPEMSKGDARQWSVMPDMPIIILPLPQENGNE